MSKHRRPKKDRNSDMAETAIEPVKDTSPKVYQNDRIGFDLKIKEFEWTDKQILFIDRGLDKATNYILCDAPPGVGKTLVSVYIGLKLLAAKRISNIYFVRLPLESASKGLGFLSGDLYEKMSPYSQPMVDHLNELLSPSDIKRLNVGNFIQSVPLGFIKGRTFNSSLLIVDEAEDLSRQELLLVMSRLGRFSKMILIGDSDQSNVKNSGFKTALQVFDNEEAIQQGIHRVGFTEADIMRNGVIQYVIRAFREAKA